MSAAAWTAEYGVWDAPNLARTELRLVREALL